MSLRTADIRRFHTRYRITHPDDCWIWTYSRNKQGYGKFRADGRHLLAHRVAYLISNGEIPAGLCICHHCDQPGCVNPAHLFVATQAENNRDRARKGRSAYPWWAKFQDRTGEKNGRAKLTLQQVGEIRKPTGQSRREIATQYGISLSQVGAIVRGERWSI